MSDKTVSARVEQIVFDHRRGLLILFLILTFFMALSATQLRMDARFNKLLPLEHEYMQTFVRYQEELGGSNKILIALVEKEGDIFNADFFAALKAVTDEVFFIPGIDRAQVRSLFTPNVRFIEIIEDGFAGGNVIPADFRSTAEGLQQVRNNILRSGEVGRLVANDFTGAIVSAQLLDIHPETGEALDYLDVAGQLEDKIRDRYQTDDIDIHIIGFAKMIGDIADGTDSVVAFFFIAVLITAVLVFIYFPSLKLSLLPVVCSLTAVIWQLGLAPLFGFGIDPMSILIPFLVFAIGLSHGVQMLSAHQSERRRGMDTQSAARSGFRRLLVPGGVALVSDIIGFLTILLIDIEIIQEAAVLASLGLLVVIFTNLVLLPVLLSYVDAIPRRPRMNATPGVIQHRLWHGLSRIAAPRNATLTLLVAGSLFVFGVWQATQIKIGDLHQGVPELYDDSRYNRDAAVIADKFSIGVDVLSVMAESAPEACVDYEVMSAIDDFSWQIRNVDGVVSVAALPTLAKIINVGWNEGNPKWHALPRNRHMLAQVVREVDTASGLLNTDCSVMPVLIYSADHRAETIDRIIKQAEQSAAELNSQKLDFRLASGNIGVLAATNEVVAAAQFPILIYVYSAIIALCLLLTRSWRASLCIVIPLSLASILTYALMTLLDIGLKVSTLPVVALGVGIGVDYGIYIFNRFQACREQGLSIVSAYFTTLTQTGNAVLFTGITLAISVSTWLFSDLKFQAEMGVLLMFIFIMNMLGALIVFPALAAWLLRDRRTTS